MDMILKFAESCLYSIVLNVIIRKLRKHTLFVQLNINRYEK